MPKAIKEALDAVHPHARGERLMLGVIGCGLAGSSPRTWGTLKAVSFRWVFGRFIPTHVGNAPEATITDSIVAVHPHARGERSA